MPGKIFWQRLPTTIFVLLPLLALLGQEPAQRPDDKGPVAVQAKELNLAGDKETKVQGKLTAQDPRDKVQKKSPCHHYVVKLLADVHYKIDLTSDDFDAFVRLEDSMGKVLAEDDDGGEGDNSRIVFKCTAADTCRIIATNVDGKEGAYVLTINKATAQELQNYNLLAEANHLTELSGKLYGQRKYAEAVSSARKALDIRKKVLGEQNQRTAHSFRNLGYVLQAQGNLKEARTNFEQALAIGRKVLGEEHYDTANALNNLGSLLQQQKEYAVARPCLEQALAIRKKVLGEQHPDTATSLNNLGSLLQDQKDYAAARPLYEQALAIDKKVLGEHTETAIAHNNLGSLLLQMEDLAAARPHMEQALAIRKKLLGEHRDTAYSLNALGNLLRQQEEYAAARPYLEQAVAIRKKLLGEQNPRTADSLNDLGHLLHEQGEFAAARPYYEQALAIYKKKVGPNHPWTASTLNNLGRLLQAQGDYREARSCYEQVLAIRRKVVGEQDPDTARVLNHLGSLMNDQGDFAAAQPYYQQALAIRKKVLGEQHPDTAISLSDLGILLQHQGDYAAARPCLEQALAIFQKTKGEHHRWTASALHNLGKLLEEHGDYAMARTHYERALAIKLKVLGEQHPATATSYHALGTMLQEQNEYAAARRYFDQELAIRKKILGEQHPDTATALSNLGVLLYEQDDFAAARPFLEQALAIRTALGEQHPSTAISLSNLGILLHAQGDYKAARTYYEKALAIHKKFPGAEQSRRVSWLLLSIGLLLRAQGDNAAARDYYEQALAVTVRGLDAAAAVHSERQQFEMARMQRFQLNTFLTLAQDASMPAEQAYAPVLAWKGSVSARQQALRSMRRILQQGKDEKTIALYQDLEQAARRLANLSLSTPDAKNSAKLREELEKAAVEVERLERALAAASAGFRKTLEQSGHKLVDVQKALPDDAALVDFLEYRHAVPPSGAGKKWIYEPRLTAFVVRKGKPVERVDLGPAKTVEDAVTAWRSRYGGGETGLALRRATWDKVAPFLTDAKLVLISPDGATARFPWGALPGKNKDTYLIEERAFAVVPVARLLPDLLGPGKSGPGPVPRSLLVIGDVDFDAAPGKLDLRIADSPVNAVVTGTAPLNRAGALGQWSRLPGAGAEAASIQKLFRQRFPDAAVTELTGSQATEATLRRHGPRHRYLHFATHGFFAPASLKSILAASSRPQRSGAISMFQAQDVSGYFPDLLSGLVLAGANRLPQLDADDGILTARELGALDLGDVELATLSACETGLGVTAGGEGLLGLQRAFQVAGAKAVTASLWKVPDEATRLLMERFYANLWSDQKMSKVEALRQAQLWMLREGRKTLEGKLRDRGTSLAEEMRGRGLDIDPPELADPRLSSFYWAAFVLSGDWR